jgi:hypothetical protein
LAILEPFGVLPPKDYKIIWLSNILALIVSDKAYSRNASCTLNLISMFLYEPTYKLSVKKLDSKAVSVVSNYLYCFGEIQLAKFGLLIDRSSSIYLNAILKTSPSVILLSLISFCAKCVSLE